MNEALKEAIFAYPDPCQKCKAECHSIYINYNGVVEGLFTDAELDEAIRTEQAKYDKGYLCDGMPSWGCLSYFCKVCIGDHEACCKLRCVAASLLKNEEWNDCD